MNTLIVSDVHLDVTEDGRATREAFVRFLDGVDTTRWRRLVIAGDLFDFWFEYRHVIFSGYFDVWRALARLHGDGVAIHFAVGNHDFWAGRFLVERLGFQIYPEPFHLEFGGMRALITHGDGLNPRDRSYRLYKRIARWNWVVGLFRLIHPDWAMAIAQGVSRGSRHLFQEEDVSKGAEVEPQRLYAESVLEEGAADICGHSHYPLLRRYPRSQGDGYYINAGDWLFHKTYVEWNGSAFRLCSFEPEEVLHTEHVTQGEPTENQE